MKIFIQLLLLLLVFSHCNHATNKEYTIADLQGDWIGEEDQEVMIVHGDKIVIHQPWLIKFLEPFRIQENEIVMDSMRFKTTRGVKKFESVFTYKIDYLKNDLLQLTEYSIIHTTHKEVLQFEKLNPLHQYEFEKLSISSSPCFGSCPVFQLEINSNSEVKFEGRSFTNKKGNYLGKIDTMELKLIQTQIDKIDWKKLQSEYWEEVSDTQYFNIEMVNKKGEKYFLTTNSPDTKAVNILIFRAFKIIENSTLEEVKENLEFSINFRDNRNK